MTDTVEVLSDTWLAEDGILQLLNSDPAVAWTLFADEWSLLQEMHRSAESCWMA